ncbi:MAG: DUF2330 domain-containing protein [bacterium]
MRKGQHSVISMSNTYQGPLEDFAMVVPVPVVLQKEMVRPSPDVFDKVDQLSAPAWSVLERDPAGSSPMSVRDDDGAHRGQRRGRARRAVTRATASDRGAVQGRRVRGAHPVGPGGQRPRPLRSPTTSTIPAEGCSALAPCIQGDMKFFVARWT